MTEYLRAPGFPDQFVVGQNAAVRVECPTREERENKMLVAQSNQQCQVTGSSVGGIQIPGHWISSGNQVTVGVKDIRRLQAFLPPLWFKNLYKEIGDGIVACHPVGIFENVMTFIFEKKDIDILAFPFQVRHQFFGFLRHHARVISTLDNQHRAGQFVEVCFWRPFLHERTPSIGRRVSEDNFKKWLSLIHISEPTRLGMISYAVFCLKKKKKQ